MPKNTPDLVALILALIVGAVTIATGAAMLYIVLTNPEQDIERLADAMGNIIGVLTAALVGYLAGRRVTNGNGHA